MTREEFRTQFIATLFCVLCGKRIDFGALMDNDEQREHWIKSGWCPRCQFERKDS